MSHTIEQVVKLIDGMEESVRRINEGADFVALAAKEQSAATDQISRNILQISAKASE